MTLSKPIQKLYFLIEIKQPLLETNLQPIFLKNGGEKNFCNCWSNSYW